jgi:hypothetical protein
VKKVKVVKMGFYAVVAGLVVAATPAAAQAQPAAPTAAQIQARHAISALEGVLENAVRYGAQMLEQRLRESNAATMAAANVGAANMVMLAGMERARGFRLDNYGVLFDVEFPSMRRSMVWSLQQLERASSGNAKIKAAAPAGSIQPREIYLTEITNALTDAIVDHGIPIGVGADEWLTVAARESVDRRFVPADPNDTAMTIILRIKGSDLAGLRDRKLAREEARKRVEVKQY